MMENGRVLFASEDRYVLAMMNSFQWLRNVWTPTVTKPVPAMGAMIRKRIRPRPAPSRKADSSIDLGMPCSSPANTMVLNDMLKATYEMTSPAWRSIRPKKLYQMKLGRSVVWIGMVSPMVTSSQASGRSFHCMRVQAYARQNDSTVARLTEKAVIRTLLPRYRGILPAVQALA